MTVKKKSTLKRKPTIRPKRATTKETLNLVLRRIDHGHVEAIGGSKAAYETFNSHMQGFRARLRNVEDTLAIIDGHAKVTMKTLADDFTRVLRQNDTLRGENETLKEMIRSRDKIADANAFISQPLATDWAKKSIPVLRVIDTALATPAPSTAVPHDIPDGEHRCRKCGYLKAAIEESGEGCIEGLVNFGLTFEDVQ